MRKFFNLLMIGGLSSFPVFVACGSDDDSNAGGDGDGAGCYDSKTHQCDCGTDKTSCSDDGGTWTDQCGCGAGMGGMGGMGGGSGDECSDTDELIIEHSFRGAYNSQEAVAEDEPWKLASGAYPIRAYSYMNNIIPITRPYFSFDVQSVHDPIIAAELRIAHSDSSYSSADDSETVKLYEVSTPSSELEALEGGENGSDLEVLTALFTDLGDGTEYGRFDVSEASNGKEEVIVLTEAALGHIKDATDIWSVGAVISSTGPSPRPDHSMERVWVDSDESTAASKLVLTLCKD